MRDQRSFSIIEISQVLNQSDDLLHSFLKLHDFEYNYSKNTEQISVAELITYKALIDHLLTLKLTSDQLDGFYLGLKLKDQADTQFDLLKPSQDTIINFEIKSDEPHKKVLEQAKDHYRFLRFAFSNPIIFEYVASKDQLFIYSNADSKLIPSQFSVLTQLMPNNHSSIEKLEKLSRSDYLVSPYNQPKEFLRRQYELTDNQKSIRTEILKNKVGAFAVKGGPGTGKTLLLLDLVSKIQNAMPDCSVGMIMGAKPGPGQIELATSMNIHLEWFYFLKDLSSMSSCDILVFDESQRIPSTLIKEALDKSDQILEIFNVDKDQVVHPDEQTANIQGLLEEDNRVKVFELKKSIRINPSLNHFQKRLFDKHAAHAQFLDFRDASVSFFADKDLLNQYLDEKRSQDWVILEPDEYVTRQTGSVKHEHLYLYSTDVKDVIGQEFKNVVILFDQYVHYEDDKLQYRKPGFYPYLELQMFYQAITRASNTVEVVVYNNEVLYLEIQRILTATRDRERKDREKISELTAKIHSLKTQLEEYQ